MFKYALFAATLLASGQPAFAQLPVNAGSQIRQIPPPPERPVIIPEIPSPPSQPAPATEVSGPAVTVNTLRITGQTLFSEDVLVAESGFVPGSAMSLLDMRALTARISAFYKERGYFLAQAYLPEQDISAGSVTIQVLEGRYGDVTLNNTSKMSDAVAQSRLSGLNRGQVISSAPLERRLLLLSDLPGIKVGSVLAPGSEVGTSDLAVSIEPGRRVTGSIEADNAGNRYTGKHRFGGSINLNQPFGIGDRLSLRVLASDSGLAYGRASYEAPLGALTLGVAYSHLRYDLGREFSNLDADGSADIASLYASYPLVRSRDANLYLVGNLDANWFKDRIGLVSSKSKKRSQTGTLGFTGDMRDDLGGGGWTTASLGWTLGTLDIRDPIDRATDALTARSDGRFSYLQYALARQQTIAGPLSLYGAVRGQVAFDNLDSSEKMELGGAYGVRAYPEGEAYGDEGFIATAEARLMLDGLTGSLPGHLQLIGFVDYGQVDFAHRPWFNEDNRTDRSGYGAGLVWFGPDNFIARGTYATRLGNQRVTSQPDNAGRAWFQIVKLF